MRYYKLKIVAVDPKTDIWVSDEDGHLVVKENGIIDEGLLPGKYFVEFGLGNTKYAIELTQDMEYEERDLARDS
jgi:hypothetical protein